MAYDLTAMARQKGLRRKSIALRPINPPAGLTAALAAIYAPSWQVWHDHRDRILASYDAVPLADHHMFSHHGVRTNVVVGDTAADTASAITAAANDFLTRLFTTIGPGLRSWTTRAERVHRSRWLAAVNGGTGIDLSSVLTAGPTEETLAVFLERNTALVKDISAQAQARISDAVFRGYQNRSPIRDVAREIDEAIGLGRKRAVRVAADQASKLSAALDTERQLEAGLSKFKWRHSGKIHPRSWHKARNGKIYYTRTGEAADGSEKIKADDRAGRPPWCGCREQAYIDLMDEI